MGGSGNVDGAIRDFGGRITLAVVIAAVAAASAGLIYGYDVGISAGVTIMPSFLTKFFPTILEKERRAKRDMYCTYDSPVLTSFTSSLYLAGLVSSVVASRVTFVFGRKFTMLVGGCTVIVGAILNGAAENAAMLILGRLFLGFGVGFTNQAAPVYISEVAPPKWRGAFSSGFDFFLGVGVVIANTTNYFSSKHKGGWRLSLALVGFPALIMTLGVLSIPDTPSSLIGRGKTDSAKRALSKIRCKEARADNAEIEVELAALTSANEVAKLASQESFTTIFQRQYRPQLVSVVLIPFFQQLTGINLIAFYAPVLLKLVGFENNAALIALVILGSVNLFSIFVSSFVVDRFGRRFLFLVGGILMFLCQVSLAGVLGASANSEHVPRKIAILILVLMCVQVNGFGLSWGPLRWLVPSEILPLRVRPAGQSISVASGFATTFILAQMFLVMLCHFRYVVFLFHAGWIAVMTIFVALFLPETKGIPLESMQVVWRKHWYWRSFVMDV